MEKLDKLDKQIDIASKSLTLAFKVGVLIGGAVLLFYCWKIGYFPKDISVGEGLLFLLLAIAFGGVYLFFVLSLTNLGIFLRPLWHTVQKVVVWSLKKYENFTGKAVNYHPFTIEKGGFEIFVFALFGVFFIVGFGLTEVKVIATLVLCTWGCALFWSIYKQNDREISELKEIKDKSDEQLARQAHLTSIQPMYFVLVLALPLLLGGVSGRLLDGAMRLANVRADKAIVNIKSPYIKYAKEFGFQGEKSIFGKDYSEFKNASILFNGFGKNVVIGLHEKDGLEKNLVVPADHIFIIQR